MTDPILTPQALRADPPLRPVGMLNLALALARGAAGLMLISSNLTSGRAVIAGWLDGLSIIGLVNLTALGIGVLLVFSAVGRTTRALGQLGAMLVPPRAPADFVDHKEDLAVAMQRQEMPAYRLPDNQQFQLAHKLFPQVFPLLTVRLREQLGAALASGTSAIRWILLIVAGLWAIEAFVPGIPLRFMPSVPFVVLGGLLIAAAARIAFVYAQFPRATPRADREEFRLSMGGGGDPKLIPIGLEHELMAFRANSGAPNRGTCYGFELAQGGVRDSGDFEGMLVVETQPAILAKPEVPMLPLLFVTAAAVTMIGLVLLVNRPEYLDALYRASSEEEATLVLVRWLLRAVGAGMLLGAASGVVAHAEHFLNVFSFSSTAIAVRVSGTFGRAGIKVGKGIHDSIESENVVIRSDSSVVGYVATIESESEGLLGGRYVTEMRANPAVTDVRHVIERWFESFSAKGADIVGLDMSSEKVAQMVNANVAIDARRSGARETARADAREAVRLASSGASPLLAAVPNEGATGNGSSHRESSGNGSVPSPDTGERPCPDCAEIIKAAARKCRFCGYRFDE